MANSAIQVKEVWENTYQINTLNNRNKLSYNQYIINDNEPILVHTGSHQQFDIVMAGISQVCAIEDLEYVIITHFESDECGALAAFMERNPDLTPVCSEVTARQLAGFDIHHDPVVKQGGETIDIGHRVLEFIDYPSEMHLWNGLLAYDRDYNGLFSSDLFLQRGPVDDPVVSEQLSLDNIPQDRIPSREKREAMGETLVSRSPDWVAPGHGPVIDLR